MKMFFDTTTPMLLLIVYLTFASGNDIYKNCTSESKCTCKPSLTTGISADCSHLNLKQIPTFDTTVVEINLSYNNISEFPANVFPKYVFSIDLSFNRISIFQNGSFHNLSKLKLKFNDQTYFKGLFYGAEQLNYVNIKNNTIASDSNKSYPIEFTVLKSLETLLIDGINKPFKKGTFQHLAYLQYLDISFNVDLSFRVLSNVSYDLQFTKISVFKGNKIYITFGVGSVLFKEDIRYLANTTLREIYLDSNRLQMIESGTLGFAPDTLRYISVADNQFTMGWYILEMAQLKYVTEINSSFQHIAHSLKNFFIEPKHRNRSCDQFVRYPCEGSVSEKDDRFNQNEVQFRNIDLRFKIPRLYFTTNVLKNIDFSWNILYEWEGPILNVGKVEYLDISNNYCSKVSKFFFQDFKNLTKLLIGGNILGFTLNTDIDGEIFSNLQSLKYLDISNNYIFYLSSKIFVGLKQLQFLNMSKNNLRKWNFDISHMSNLKFIDMSHNQLTDIPLTMRQSLDRISLYRNISLDLTDNNFFCACPNIEFLKWLLASKISFKHFDRYTCELSNGTLINFAKLRNYFVEFELKCSSKAGLIAGASSAIFVSIVFIIVGIVYRYRWKLRYLYYMTKSKYRGYTSIRTPDQDGEYEFDAFVSYADSDRKFVLEDVINNLEKEGGCRLCIHHRDFTPGLDIADNITSSIHKSNKTILILSPDFLKSYWCMFEFNMARMESIYSRDGRNVLFLVFYKNVSGKDLPLVMLDLIESQSYIEYPNDAQGNVVFWDKIREALSMTPPPILLISFCFLLHKFDILYFLPLPVVFSERFVYKIFLFVLKYEKALKPRICNKI
ncbi:hypothetical protein KUTeg_021203 [Tegillarca granosa]|uniref:TIR domain-containing protein n=1 Tax=Tegillarca granosa TaxID=220873 RepID=A0ABQ9EEE9_TEGGR|nr:hypothetical protein KUTeg_021203 [Tegillarca granosa]